MRIYTKSSRSGPVHVYHADPTCKYLHGIKPLARRHTAIVTMGLRPCSICASTGGRRCDGAAMDENGRPRPCRGRATFQGTRGVYCHIHGRRHTYIVALGPMVPLKGSRAREAVGC